MTMITARARAYVNHGRWVSDCPAGCGSALALAVRQTMYHCVECQHLAYIEWPHNADEIWDALQARPKLENRNWFPTGHDLALRGGCPTGQSVAELDAETKQWTEVPKFVNEWIGDMQADWIRDTRKGSE